MRTVYMDDILISGVRQYCDACCGEASKNGRRVRATKWGDYCSVCESRVREGLVFYIPSNGSEGMAFEERCERCLHGKTHPDHGYLSCEWGILDRILDSGWEDRDSSKLWHDPANLTDRGLNGEYICPARCLRFTNKGDGDGESRRPPPSDCIGQMTFDDILAVPVERVPVLSPAGQP